MQEYPSNEFLDDLDDTLTKFWRSRRTNKEVSL